MKDLLAALEALYRDVFAQVKRLDDVHSTRLQCRRGCTSCCVDDISVFEIEAHNIRHHCTDLLDVATPHDRGSCAFLDGEGSCRIYEHRPYVCRTQGYPLRWMQDQEDGVVAEMRDICPLNDVGEPIETLPEAHCWTIGPFEERLAALQFKLDGGRMNRVALRELFRRVSKEP